MEVVIVADAEAARRDRRRHRRAAPRRQARSRARRGDRELADRHLPPSGRGVRRRTRSASPTPTPCCSTSTSGSPPIIRSATDGSCTSNSSTTSTCRRPRPRARCRRRRSDGGRPPVRGAADRARRRRCAIARHRHRWSRRLQRARLVVAVAHPHQDADRRDTGRQRPLLPEHPDDVPHHVMTQGLATIGDARHLVLVACGAAKAAPVAAAVEGPLTASCPASILQWHPHVTVVIDEERGVGPGARRVLPRDARREAVMAAVLTLRSAYNPGRRDMERSTLRLENTRRRGDRTVPPGADEHGQTRPGPGRGSCNWRGRCPATTSSHRRRCWCSRRARSW